MEPRARRRDQRAATGRRSAHAACETACLAWRRKELPAPPDNRAYLPAIEPERQITDWGRSERVEAFFDKTLYEFLYHYWFRVEVEGIENVPATGPRAARRPTTPARCRRTRR